MARNTAFAFFLIGSVCIAGCAGGSGGGGGTQQPPQSQTIAFAQPTSTVTYAPAGVAVTLSATGGGSGNPVVFTVDSSSTGKGTVSGDTLTATGAGNLVIDANQAGNSSYSAAAQVQKTLTVNQATPTVSAWPTASAITSGQTLASSTLTGGTASVPGAFAWTNSGTVPALGTDPESVTFMPTDSTDYSTVTGSVTVTVATPTALVVTITDLPAGTLASVTVTDPNGQQTMLTSSQTINAIPGSYILAAAPVVVGTSTYHATQTTQTVTVTSGSTATAIVDYYNVIPNTTKVLDQAGAQGLSVSSDGSTLTISSSSAVAQSLQPGDVLVSAPIAEAPNGLLVKVTAATNSGSSIVVTSTPATLADEVTQARFGVDIPFVLPNSSPAVQEHAGYAIRAGSLAAPQAGSLTNPCTTASSLSLPFSYSLAPDQNQNTLTASGELDFCNLHVDFQITPLSTYAKATVSLQQYSNLVVQGQYSTSFDWNEPLDETAFENQVVCLGNETCEAIVGLQGSVGNALAVISPSITPFVGMTGSASGGVYLGGAESGSFQAGIQVQGVTASPIYSGTLQQESFPTAVDGTLDVKGYFGVTLAFTLLGSVTDHVDPRAYAELTADTGANPWWTLSLGDEASAGITLSFLGFGSSEHDTPEYTIYSGQLAQAPGPYAGQPLLSSVMPNAVAQYSASRALAIVGQNFVPGCFVTFNGTPLATTYSDPTSLTAILPASLLGTSGSYSMAVLNSNVTGTTSNTLPFTVTASPNNPVPTITQLNPVSLAAGATPQTVAINGTGFLTSSTVTFNGVTHAPTYMNASQLTISLTTADLATAGSYPVVVTNPAPGGGASTAAYFTVINPQTANEWTWMSGSKLVNGAPVYGTLGVASPTNVPGARGSATSWTDHSGNLWLFGGYGLDSSGDYWGNLNDLWIFSPSSNTWTWVSGSNSANVGGVYGTKGLASTSNIPGSRSGATSWIDGGGNLWLFGGGINDLWEFNPANKTWTWVSGTDTSSQPGAYGAMGVPSAANVPGARSNGVSWIDGEGNLWLFGGQGSDSTGNGGYLNDLWEFNPANGTWTWVGGSNTLVLFADGLRGEPGVYGTQGISSAANVPGGRLEANSWIDSSGNLWLFGGYGQASATSGAGVLNDLWEFNPTNKQWTWVGGADTPGQAGVYGTLGVAATANVPGARELAVSWTDASGNFWLFGGIGDDSVGYYQYLNDLWEFNPSNKTWTWISGSNRTGAIGVWGTLGVAAPTNVPGARDQGVSWIDNGGYLWLFSGYGSDSVDNGGYLNDLWRYQP